jgi:hypothetical protein
MVISADGTGGWQSSLFAAFLIALISLAASACFFAPRLWLMDHYQPGTFQWDRAHTYLLQVENPFRSDIENVMRWRLLPALLAHLARLPGKVPLVIPWLGLIAATTYVARVLQRHCAAWRFVLGGTLLFATTSAVIVPIQWYGMNDPWVWLGLFVIAFARSPIALVAACLLCPWVDERFIIGVPLAWTGRCVYNNEPLISRTALLLVIALMLYAALRLGITSYFGIRTEGTHLARLLPQMPVSAKYGYLGWWMGLRAAWAPIAFLFLTVQRPYVLAAVFLLTAAVTIALTEDQSRSAAIVVPIVILGLLSIQRRYPEIAPRAAIALGILGLILPATHVGNNSIVPYDNILVEIFRWYRGV